MFQSLYKKCLNLAAHKSSNFYLGLVSFIESSFFPIPPDVMIIPMVIAKKKEFIKIFLIASIFSVLGGILGYLIGYLFFDFAMYVIELYNYENKVKDVVETIKNNFPYAFKKAKSQEFTDLLPRAIAFMCVNLDQLLKCKRCVHCKNSK